MDDLIRREDAIDAVHKTVGKFIPILMVSEENALLDCVTAINRLPSARKKGQWEDEETNYLCSVCHRGCWVNSDFCPWCGSDMRGDGDG